MSTGVDILVRRTCPSDESGFESFYKTAFGAQVAGFKFPGRWRWLNIENPFRPDDQIPLWLAMRGDTIVGQTGAMYVPCKIGDTSRLAAWSVDTILLPELRGKGVGKRLQEANQSAHQVFMSLSMNAANRAIKEKLGATEGPTAILYARVNRVDSRLLRQDVERWAREGSGMARRLCVSLFTAIGGFRILTAWLGHRFRRRQAALPAKATEGFEFQPIDGAFGEEADALWRTVRGDYDFAVERTAEYLNWRYVQPPDLSYQRFYALRDGDVAGAVVFRQCGAPEAEYGVICDVICPAEDVGCVRAMIAHACAQLDRGGAMGVYCASALPGHQACLEDMGFLRTDDRQMMIFDATGAVCQLPASYTALVGKGDHDWDAPLRTIQPTPRTIRAMLAQ